MGLLFNVFIFLLYIAVYYQDGENEKTTEDEWKGDKTKRGQFLWLFY